jgi:excinuclease ABC subunit B
MSLDQLKKTIEETKKRMNKAAKDLDFLEAARLRDEMFALQEKLNEKEKV